MPTLGSWARNLRIDNDLFHVVGVMPPGFHDPGRTEEERNTEIWAALGFAGDNRPPPLRGTRGIQQAIARMKPGLSFAAAQSQMDALAASLQKQFPADYPAVSGWKSVASSSCESRNPLPFGGGGNPLRMRPM